MSASSWLALAGFIVVCFLSTVATARFRPDDWYERLAKPSWRPPNWLFAPVWTVLYLMIAVSGWLVWRERGFADAVWPFAIYAVQLVLNGIWTPIFFGMRRPDLAFLDIVLVWLSIVATIAAGTEQNQATATAEGSPAVPAETGDDPQADAGIT